MEEERVMCECVEESVGRRIQVCGGSVMCEGVWRRRIQVCGGSVMCGKDTGEWRRV